MMEHEVARLGQHWGWMFASGVLYLLLGIFALNMPIASTLGLTFAIGGVLVVSGAIQLVQAFRLRNHSAAALRFLQSFVSLLVGGLMLRYPGGGMLGIALALSFYFFLSAAFQFTVYSGLRPMRGSGWGLVSAILTFALGIYMVFTFPASALWVPGLLLGIDLIFAGVGLMSLSWAIHKMDQQIMTSDPTRQKVSA